MPHDFMHSFEKHKLIYQATAGRMPLRYKRKSPKENTNGKDIPQDNQGHTQQTYVQHDQQGKAESLTSRTLYVKKAPALSNLTQGSVLGIGRALR